MGVANINNLFSEEMFFQHTSQLLDSIRFSP